MAGELQHARKLIGCTLLVLLIAVVVLGFAALFQIEAQSHAVNHAVMAAVEQGDGERLTAAAKIMAEQSQADGERLSQLLAIIFGPVVTLLGSVTGFYFGTKNRP